MKNVFYPLMIVLSASLAWSCSDSVSDEFDDVNGKIEVKLMKSIAVSSDQDPNDDTEITFAYNANNTLNKISNGSETSIFVYDDNKLTNVNGAGQGINMEELYGSPHNAFETGQVEEYDDKGNPKRIVFYEDDYDYEIQDYVIREYKAELSYDDTHNPLYPTLQAAGIIDVLDNVKLNLSSSPQNSKTVQARLLFPLNNLNQIVYKNEEGEIMLTINAHYVYDALNYPTSADVTAVSVDSSQENSLAVTFTYVE